jgi:catechol 2,3-dioxygenase-like lactoylglutathione lyase family enzyme
MPALNAIGITVSDFERSLTFYRLLGLDLPESPGENGHVEATMPNGTRLMFDTEDVIRSFLPDWRRTDGNQVGLAFECASPAEVDEIYARVVAAGFESEKEPWDAFWGQRYALLRDPDGVSVNLYAPLP